MRLYTLVDWETTTARGLYRRSEMYDTRIIHAVVVKEATNASKEVEEMEVAMVKYNNTTRAKAL